MMYVCVRRGRPPVPAINPQGNELSRTVGGALRGPWDD